ncbi:MAG: hypothetical protein IJR93_07975 [Treponema sp.]|nr:hypothetical protein [Treponema sp.]
MMEQRKIHFINRIDINNAGDWNCCPLMHWYSYFRDFSVIRHDIDFVDYAIINRDDIVIIGAGGMLNVTVSFNKAINKILDLCDTVIAWSVGFNTHNEQWFQGNDFPRIDLSRFAMIAIRDYEHHSGIEYLPCPSVFSLYRTEELNISLVRKYGLIEHVSLPVDNPFFSDKINNSESISKIAEYIRTSEVIITNSYHCAYWTVLLGRKCIVVNKFSTKFDFFKYKPEFISIAADEKPESVRSKLEEASLKARVYPSAYDEAVNMNNVFFGRVRDIIENQKIPRCKDFQNFYYLSVPQSWQRLVPPSKIEEKIFELHEDVYANFASFKNEFKSDIENVSLTGLLRKAMSHLFRIK